VSSGAVSLKNKTSYWSAHHSAFTTPNPDVDDILHSFDDGLTTEAGSILYFCPVFLPHGAVVTGAVVYGDFGVDWILYRSIGYGGVVMATAGASIEDTTITNPEINNEDYQYFFLVPADSNFIWGARIKYTTDYD